MDSAPTSTTVAPSGSELAGTVRAALAGTYARPLVVEQGDGVAVLAGRALELARAAAGDAADRVVELDVANLPWHAAPTGGLRLWRQHGLDGADGELVTEVEDGDPPLQLVVAEEGWQLLRLADGAQGWVRECELVPCDAPAGDLGDATRVEVERFLAELVGLEGVPYVWGGTTADGVDCSGIVQRAAWRAGFADRPGAWLPRHSRALLRAGARVAPSAVARGDVLVLQRDPATVDAERAAQLAARAAEEQRTGRVPAHGPAVHPMHVAVALSADEVLHASRDAMRVVREPLATLRERYRVLGVRRLGPPPTADEGPGA
ncbi:MAG: hypothetical protein JWM98_2758 [Thermoleophilia bacterium]|nr:hypothetical protein [Thermoleophilia bacterium]